VDMGDDNITNSWKDKDSKEKMGKKGKKFSLIIIIRIL
jgi:hypothetical protein